MANYTIDGLTTAVVGIASTVAFQPQSQNVEDNVTSTNGTVPAGNIDLSNEVTTAIPGWLSGRRPQKGQLFPRGVYNK